MCWNRRENQAFSGLLYSIVQVRFYIFSRSFCHYYMNAARLVHFLRTGTSHKLRVWTLQLCTVRLTDDDSLLEDSEKSPLLSLIMFEDIIIAKYLRNSIRISIKIVIIEYCTRDGIKGGLFSGCSWYSLFYQPAGIIPVPVSCRTYRKTL